MKGGRGRAQKTRPRGARELADWDFLLKFSDTDLALSPGLLVPKRLAEDLNRQRSALSLTSEADAFARAAAVLPSVKRELDARTAEEVKRLEANMARAAREAAWREAELAEAASATADSAEEAPPEVEPPDEAAARAPKGVSVEVLSPTMLARVREKAKGSYRKGEAAQFEALARAGASRLVQLRPDWADRLDRLESEMPNFRQVLASIRAQCALAEKTGTPLRIAPLLLVGGPGVGKSHFGLRLAESLELPSFLYNMESSESTSVLLGSERHWTDSQSGVLLRLVLEDARRVANPVIIVDEVDKAPNRGNHYRPRDALIPLLERATAVRLRDKSLELEFDGSYVIYLATANALRPIEPPLLSRFEVHLIRSLEPDEAVTVVRRMEEAVRMELGLHGFDRPEPAAIQELALIGNPRLVGRLLRQGFARAMQRGGARLTLGDLHPVDRDGGTAIH